MATAKTIYTPAVDEILPVLIPGVHEALGDNLVGLYLRGSLATGDFIDAHNLAVTREVDHHQDRFIYDPYPPDLPEADFLVEVHRAVEILHPVGGVESLH